MKINYKKLKFSNIWISIKAYVANYTTQFFVGISWHELNPDNLEKGTTIFQSNTWEEQLYDLKKFSNVHFNMHCMDHYLLTIIPFSML